MINVYTTTQQVADYGFGIPEGSVVYFASNHEDFSSWANSLFQDKKFKTQKEFNEAYDRVYHGGAPKHQINRCDRTVKVSREDIGAILKSIKRQETDPEIFGSFVVKSIDQLDQGLTLFLS